MNIEIQKDGKIATFIINRPEAMNALNPEAVVELSRALIEFREDENLWVGIITGAGEKAFCAGADIKTMLPNERKYKGNMWQKPPSIYRGLDLWKPVIAAVNGLCLGGGLEIAMACDFRVAAEKARFGLPEVTLGLIPGMGGTQRLPRLIPLGKAAEMMYTGAIIDAQEAYRIGLVNKVFPPESLMEETKKIAQTICQAGPLAVRAAKQAMYQGMQGSMSEGLQLESLLTDYIFDTEDFTEGTRAFIEKRKPIFKGK
ncbi:MAG TPA: enoyl-CoA hydratase-related protein [Dehalococcoidia bacterium]|nr:enoyl-CoA hydratase-related protein [Dehalococcoidia bacterium]